MLIAQIIIASLVVLLPVVSFVVARFLFTRDFKEIQAMPEYDYFPEQLESENDFGEVTDDQILEVTVSNPSVPPPLPKV